jgi:hypothetical protein
VDERLLFDQLPHYLRGEVASFLTDEMLRESRAFGNLGSESRRLVNFSRSPSSKLDLHHMILFQAWQCPKRQHCAFVHPSRHNLGF